MKRILVLIHCFSFAFYVFWLVLTSARFNFVWLVYVSLYNLKGDTLIE